MKTTEQIDETLAGPEVAGTTGESPSVAIRRRREERPATPEEMAAFDAAVAKWRGTGTERMKRLGFNSTDEFIDAIRGRNADGIQRTYSERYLIYEHHPTSETVGD